MNKKDFAKHQSICPLPWHGVYVNPDGNVKNCAISKEVLGNINDVPLENCINSNTNRQIRQDMINNVRHDRCLACYKVEDIAEDRDHNQSNRSWYKKMILDHNNDLSFFESANNFTPTVLDLRWHNTCNHACVYCGPDLSSLWEGLLNTNCDISNEVNLQQSKDYVVNNLSSVQHIYLAGGEPLLMKENYSLLTKLLEVNPDASVRINSNISNLNTPVYTELKKFKNVVWTISVDSINDNFEYMRWPGKWDQFESNLTEIQSNVGDQINFNMVWCILNAFEIFDAFDYLLAAGYHENMFIVQCLTSPTPLSLLHLPRSELTKLKEEISSRLGQCNPEWWLYKSLVSMYNFLDKPAPVDEWVYFNGTKVKVGLEGTLQYLELTDQIRSSNNSKDVFYNLYKIYDSNQRPNR